MSSSSTSTPCSSLGKGYSSRYLRQQDQNNGEAAQKINMPRATMFRLLFFGPCSSWDGPLVTEEMMLVVVMFDMAVVTFDTVVVMLVIVGCFVVDGLTFFKSARP